MTTLACPCCGWAYTMGNGEWYGHPCSGYGKGASHHWQESWCHLDKPGAAPRENACGKCVLHCQCPDRQRNNFPVAGPEETIQQFVARLSRTKREAWQPFKDSDDTEPTP